MMEAGGFFADGMGITAAPVVRVGVSFGRGLVVGAAAVVDTGSDLCMFPESLFPWPIPEKGDVDVGLEMADGRVVPATIAYPTINAGDIREAAVATAILPEANPVVGRSFLNRLALRMTASHDLVRLRTIGARRA